MELIRSVHGVPIRFTDERWEHIQDGHPDRRLTRTEIIDSLQDPAFVCEGLDGEYLAVREIESSWIVVPYRELSPDDGFVITAFIAKTDPGLRRRVIWIKQS